MDERPVGSAPQGRAPDPHDLIVGTIDVPDRLTRIPLGAWLFVGLAVLGAGVELFGHGSLVGPTGLTTPNLLDVVAGAVFVGSVIALPAGIRIGDAGVVRAEDRLYRGAVILALATLFGLLWEAFAWQGRRAFMADGPFEVGLGEAGLARLAMFGRSVQAAFVLIGGGLMALGLRDRAGELGARASPWRRHWPLIVAGTFATAVSLAVPLVGFAVQDRAGDLSDPHGSWAMIDLVLLIVIATTPLAWAAIALGATRGSAAAVIHRRGWALAAAGGVVLVASTVVRAAQDVAGWSVSSQLLDARLAVDNDVWYAWTAVVGLLAAIGAILLLAGCAVGLGSVPARTESEPAPVARDPVDLPV